jgi:hypothetical protein
MQKSDAKNPDLLKNFPSDASQKGEEYLKENAIWPEITLTALIVHQT